MQGDEVTAGQQSLGADYVASWKEGNQLQVGVQSEDEQ